MSCPDCFRGGISFEKPTGSETTIHGLRSYVAQPAEAVIPKAVIVFISDAFGWEFVNNRVLCDRYAQKGGFLVYLPDFMDGERPPYFIPLPGNQWFTNTIV
jgi:dienelactone hydrolase